METPNRAEEETTAPQTHVESDAPPDEDAPPSGQVTTHQYAQAPQPPRDKQEDVPPELVREVALGSTPTGTSTNNALRALSRAARSFLLYDPANDAIRVFLQDYQESMVAALQFGQIELVIRPFEMVQNGEIVYLERDRERSLAFRMFRDGVRRLTISPAATWNELLRLLEILSIRYTGVRQQEDDIVTLLWKAGFVGIEIAAVEGFVPDSDRNDDRLRAERDEDSLNIPRDWDQPLPDFDETLSHLSYVEIPQTTLTSLQQEASSSSIASNALRLVEQMLLVVQDITDPTEFSDIYPLIQEVRDFLLAEGQLDGLTRMARSVNDFFGDRKADAARVIGTFINERALRRVIRSASKVSDEVPLILYELLDLVPSDHLPNLVTLLQSERTMGSRNLIRQLIGRYIKGRVPFLINHIPTSDSDVAKDLLIAIAESAPEHAIHAVEVASSRTETAIQFEILRVLNTIPFGERVRIVLLELLNSSLEDIRLQALDKLISNRDDPRLFATLVRHTQNIATSRLQPKEAEAIGRALASLNPSSAQRLLSNWIRPRGLLRRLGAGPGQRMLRWTAVSGLGRLSGDDNEKLIRWMAEQAGEDLRKHCMHTLFVRRKEKLFDV